MELSVFDIFKVGIGPSSSHTVGPMRAAGLLLVELENLGIFDRVGRVQCEFYGSLAATGRGHHTDRAVIWGLIGQKPETIAPDDQEPLYQSVVSSAELLLQGRRSIQFIPDRDIIFRAAEQLPYHPNGMRFTVFDSTDAEIYTKQFYSIGGGFVVGDERAENDQLIQDPVSVEYPFFSCDELLEIARETGKSIAEIVLACLRFLERFVRRPGPTAERDYLLAAGAIGALYATNASISGAEVGCQGEVGVACSMAAGGLAQAAGGTPRQVENAAEIGMEHNLGLTCDPIGGLVQIPCIERNAMAAVKAVNAARMALRNEGGRHVSLDQVIVTMRETGRDMQSKYKETSTGGLAINVTEC
jgi:L-serine dehydratase